MNLYHFIIFSLFLFSVGIYGVLTRRSAVGILIAIELMLNAGAINLAVFNRYLAPDKVDGQIMALFVMAVAAAEVLVGMAILIMLFRRKKSVDIGQLDILRH